MYDTDPYTEHTHVWFTWVADMHKCSECGAVWAFDEV